MDREVVDAANRVRQWLEARRKIRSEGIDEIRSYHAGTASHVALLASDLEIVAKALTPPRESGNGGSDA